MHLNLKYSGDTSDPQGEVVRTRLFTILRRALHREAVSILTSEGWEADPDDPSKTRLMLFWWSGHRTDFPVLAIADLPDTLLVYWEAPESWNDHWASRFNRDCERFVKNMERGDQGRMLPRFRLGTTEMIDDFLRGSLDANQAATH